MQGTFLLGAAGQQEDLRVMFAQFQTQIDHA
jgi:hypothetical protein